MRVFLDANILFSAAYSATSPLHRLWEEPLLNLVTCGLAVDEAERNLRVHRPSALDSLRTLMTRVEVLMTVYGPSPVQLEPKDVPILCSAIASESDWLLTGDRRHFGELYGRSVSGVRIQAPSTFIAEQLSPPQ